MLVYSPLKNSRLLVYSFTPLLLYALTRLIAYWFACNLDLSLGDPLLLLILSIFTAIQANKRTSLVLDSSTTAELPSEAR